MAEPLFICIFGVSIERLGWEVVEVLMTEWGLVLFELHLRREIIRFKEAAPPECLKARFLGGAARKGSAAHRGWNGVTLRT
jgi:hypothetical protein